jgi:hypothetical protein
MNGSLRPDLYNVVLCGGIGLVFVFVYNRVVTMAGKAAASTSGAAAGGMSGS